MHKGDTLQHKGWTWVVIQVRPDSFIKNDDGSKTYFDNYQILSPVGTVIQHSIERV